MARKGRKRSKAARTRTGQLRRLQADRDVTMLVQCQPHRRGLPEDMRRTQLAESALGRLYLAGALGKLSRAWENIPDELLWAGQRYQRLVAAYQRVILAPVSTRSSGFAYVADSLSEDDARVTDRLDHLATMEDEAEAYLRITWEMRHAHMAIEWMRPEERSIIDGVCLRNEDIGWRGIPAGPPFDRLIALHSGLRSLAQHFGLLERRQAKAHAWVGERPVWDESTDTVVLNR